MSQSASSRVSGRRPSREDRIRALESFEERLVRQNKVPDAGRLLSRRLAGVMQILVAVVVGIVVGTVSVIASYVLLNKLLHM